MILFNLPHPIAAFVDILERRDTAALLALFAPGAIIKGCHPKYGSQKIDRCAERKSSGTPSLIAGAVTVPADTGPCRTLKIAARKLNRQSSPIPTTW